MKIFVVIEGFEFDFELKYFLIIFMLENSWEDDFDVSKECYVEEG